VDLDGTHLTRLTTKPAFDTDPAYSPDGRHIVFTSTGDDGNADIWQMNADGGDLTRLTTDPAFDHAPAFSPDGSAIVFASDRRGNSDGIWVMSANGAQQSCLTLDGATDTDPSWGPAGADRPPAPFGQFGPATLLGAVACAVPDTSHVGGSEALVRGQA
jgi:TolB protein